MRTLYHWRLDPFSRQARVALAEKGMRARLVEEHVWDGRQDFLSLNPAGATPVLVLEPGQRRTSIVGARALLEYLEEIQPDPPFLPRGAPERAEARRMADWFDRKFDAEVNAYLLFEKVEKKITGGGPPDPAAIREGRVHLKRHLAYVSQLAEGRGWLAGDKMSIADIAGAAHLSCLDYLGEPDWDEVPPAREWYQKIKARPSFDSLLQDVLPGIAPARAYADVEI